MAGMGPPPKDSRRRRNVPARGEWVDLPPLARFVLPPLPTGKWSARTRAAWKRWRSDPATGMYGPAEIQDAIDLAYMYEEWVQEGGAKRLSEVRQMKDRLGLNAKGKRDLRWRVGDQAAAEKPALAEVRQIRAVDAKAVS